MEQRQRDEFITQVLSTIEEAEVLTIFFPNLAKALVVDVRHSYEESPMVKVVNQVNSMEERMVSIEKMRPLLGQVRSIAGIPWTKSVRTLKENEIIDSLMQRLVAAGMYRSEAKAACEEAVRSLQEVEYNQWIDLIKAQSPLYKTIWEDNN
jgi:MinD-like ATPase involved in chromosome partitioning or flagellar assembly